MIDEHMAYAGYCGTCGRMVAATVDDPKHRRGKDGSAAFVAELIRDGCRVERIACQSVREELWGCTDDCACKFCVKKRKAKKNAEPEFAL